MGLPLDFKDLLAVFAKHGVQYLVVGGYAVAFHGKPRFTKDIDLWIGPNASNAARAAEALRAFGAPPDVASMLRDASEQEIVYLGAAPCRVEIFKAIPGVGFEQSYARRAATEWDGVPVSVIGIIDLIASKRAVNRPQDREDLKMLARSQEARPSDRSRRRKPRTRAKKR